MRHALKSPTITEGSELTHSAITLIFNRIACAYKSVILKEESSTWILTPWNCVPVFLTLLFQ